MLPVLACSLKQRVSSANKAETSGAVFPDLLLCFCDRSVDWTESMSNAVKENDVEQGTLASYLNRPIVFTLGAEVRKAAYTVHNFTKE